MNVLDVLQSNLVYYCGICTKKIHDETEDSIKCNSRLTWFRFQCAIKKCPKVKKLYCFALKIAQIHSWIFTRKLAFPTILGGLAHINFLCIWLIDYSFAIDYLLLFFSIGARNEHHAFFMTSIRNDVAKLKSLTLDKFVCAVNLNLYYPFLLQSHFYLLVNIFIVYVFNECIIW